MDILKAEIARKRKLLEEKKLVVSKSVGYNEYLKIQKNANFRMTTKSFLKEEI